MEAQFFRFLKIVGVGYKARAEAQGRLLYLKLGYSHEVELTVPLAVRTFEYSASRTMWSAAPELIRIGCTSSLLLLFAVASRLKFTKGKGIMYIDEVIKKKQGKKSK